MPLRIKPRPTPKLEPQLAALARALREYTEAQRASRDSLNQANRLKTAARNAFVEYARLHDLPPEAKVVVDNVEFSYGVATAEVIPVEVWFEWYKQGHITEAVFLACLSVSKEQVKLHAGADIAVRLSRETPGKTADLRSAETDEATTQAVAVVVPKPPNLTKAFDSGSGKRKLVLRTLKR